MSRIRKVKLNGSKDLTFDKAPGALLDYTLDWSDYLAVNEIITASIWIVPTGLTQVRDSLSGALATVWLSGGVEDTDYEVTNHIVTSDGREDDRTITIKVRKR